MKDNLSLMAAATGGFMLSVALSGILHGSPVLSSQRQPSFYSLTVTTFRPATREKNEDVEFFNDGGNG
ncbi:hypothetical protein WA1_12990 [Scytonema hofmannii PCC 7110]|uniref:Uncharacterized protein n=1 Tax=Scytonema hofmannii PCC 7110 TaxID=128403 RepID=A0A139XED5_9CYAN|nr:hypothetical protein [Scytonema hofmannii]KYC43013.1 hypothetical protein WA1_12990 [Scytonema hofmannii PCC 7110]